MSITKEEHNRIVEDTIMAMDGERTQFERTIDELKAELEAMAQEIAELKDIRAAYQQVLHSHTITGGIIS